MLVLTRKRGQRIIINNDIEITYLGDSLHRPGQIRLGITAPENIEVHRHEIQENIQKYGRIRHK